MDFTLHSDRVRISFDISLLKISFFHLMSNHLQKAVLGSNGKLGKVKIGIIRLVKFN